MGDLFEVVNEPNKSSSPVTIKVIGVGGCGGNAVEHICKNNELEVDFLCANTDLQALMSIKSGNNKLEFIQLGRELTGGKGAGAKPEVGKNAALETEKEIEENLRGADMLFITAGMGGGTGTGAAPVVAAIAKKLNILTLAIVTTPFEFEGKLKAQAAEEGIKNLRDNVDSVIIVPNEKLLEVLPEDISMTEAYAESDEVLSGAVKGVSHIITNPGKRNIDFADVQTVMSDSGGLARMGVGRAIGDNRIEKAIREAMNNPLLSDMNIKEAKGILANLSTSSTKTLAIKEFKMVSKIIGEYVAQDATVIYGDTIDESLGEDVMVTIVATGFDKSAKNVIDRRDAFAPKPSNFNNIRKQQPLSGNNPNNGVRNFVSPIQGQAQSAGRNGQLVSTDEIYDVPTYIRRQSD